MPKPQEKVKLTCKAAPRTWSQPRTLSTFCLQRPGEQGTAISNTMAGTAQHRRETHSEPALIENIYGIDFAHRALEQDFDTAQHFLQ